MLCNMGGSHEKARARENERMRERERGKEQRTYFATGSLARCQAGSVRRAPGTRRHPGSSTVQGFGTVVSLEANKEMKKEETFFFASLFLYRLGGPLTGTVGYANKTTGR